MGQDCDPLWAKRASVGMLFLCPESPGFTPPAPQSLALTAAAQAAPAVHCGHRVQGSSWGSPRAGQSGWRWGHAQLRGSGGPGQTEQQQVAMQGPEWGTWRGAESGQASCCLQGLPMGSAAPRSLQVGADGSTRV